jgi:phosphate transport system substrate-binding protein
MRYDVKKTPAVALAVLLLLTACDGPQEAADPVPCASGSAAGQGSSAQANVVNEWIKQYQIACAQAAVVYASVGSGAGVRAFVAGTGDFAGTDAALGGAEESAAATRCGGSPAVHLPMVIGPIAVAYNVAGVGGLRLAPATIAKIFNGKVTAWNDKVIAADNPDMVLPATPIRAVHREDSSGTTSNFTRFLAGTAKVDWPYDPAGAWPAPGGVAVPGSDRLASAIGRTDGAIGYVEVSYARVNELATALVGDSRGGFVPPTDEAAASAVVAAKPAGGDDLRLEFDYQPLYGGAYPLVQVTYEVVCRSGASAVARGLLAYAAGPAGQAAVSSAGYAPLPDTLRERVYAVVAGLR